MPAKKAAKKVAKKASKKAAHHHTGHDLRRAYEHLGRIEVLDRALDLGPSRDIKSLAELAQQELAAGNGKSAADLLRAAEHLSFAGLAGKDSARISPDLKAAIAAEFSHLNDRAARHWSESTSRHAPVSALYPSLLKQAQAAFAAEQYRPALELARAAEALAHITRLGPARLPATGERAHRLAS